MIGSEIRAGSTALLVALAAALAAIAQQPPPGSGLEFAGDPSEPHFGTVLARGLVLADPDGARAAVDPAERLRVYTGAAPAGAGHPRSELTGSNKGRMKAAA